MHTSTIHVDGDTDCHVCNDVIDDVAGVVKGERWFQGKWLLCEVVASMCLTACFCAFLSLTLMTLNKYVYVCMNTWYHKIFKVPSVDVNVIISVQCSRVV